MSISRVRFFTLVLTSAALIAPAAALAHDGHGPEWNGGRVPGMPDFKRSGEVTTQFRPAKGEYEVRVPGEPVTWVHGDPVSGGGHVTLPSQTLAPICRPLGRQIVVVFTHRPEDSTPTPTATLRNIVQRMNWKIADQSSISSEGKRVVQMAVNCNGKGEINVYDVVTPTNDFTTVSAKVREQVNPSSAAQYPLKYLVFDSEGGDSAAGLGDHASDNDKNRTNQSSSSSGVALTYAPYWSIHTPVHELFHTLGASQGWINPIAPFSTFGSHCTDGLDILCYDDGSARSENYSESYCPASSGFDTPVNVPIDCNKDTYFDADPSPGTYLDEYWDVAGIENPFLVTLPSGTAKVTTLGATAVTANSAVLNGSFTPNGDYSNYYFEYWIPKSSHQLWPEGKQEDREYGTSSRAVSHKIENLEPNTEYRYRMYGSNDNGTTVSGGELGFTTEALPPTIVSQSVSATSEGTAVLSGAINPEKLSTSYQMEYGPTESYGQLVPGSKVNIGAGLEDVPVSQEISGLERLKGYNFRIVASNSKGTSKGSNVHFAVPDWPFGLSAQFGASGSEEGQLENPKGVALDAEGDLWVADRNNKRVAQFSGDGEFVNAFQGSGAGVLANPVDVAVSPTGTIWVLDIIKFQGPGRAVEFDQNGNYLRQTSTISTTGQSPSGIDVGPNGRVWVSVQKSSSTVEEFTAEGEFVQSLSLGIPKVRDVSIDSEGHIWVLKAPDKFIELSTGGAVLKEISASIGEGAEEFDITNSGRFLVTSPSSMPDEVREFLSNGDLVGKIAPAGNDWEPGGVVAGPGRSFYVSRGGADDQIERWVGGSKPIVSTGSAVEVTPTGAKLSGIVNATGFETKYHFEYDTAEYKEGEVKSHGISVPSSPASIGSKFSDVAVNQSITGLSPGTLYHYRLVAENKAGTSYGQDRTLGGAPPTVATEDASDVQQGTATLNATVNPEGLETEYHFEYDTTEYKKGGSPHGTSVPIPEKSIEAGSSDVEVDEGIEGLKAGTTYHYRVVAGNEIGTTYGEDKAFTTPPTYALSYGGTGTGDGKLSYPTGIATDSAGNTWVLDSGNDRVQKFNSKGEYVSKFGSSGSNPGQLSEPLGIEVDSAGNVWVVDSGNDRVQKFNSKGEYLDQFGSSGSNPGQLSYPLDLAIDSAGNLWVSDSNDRIQKFSSSGEYKAQFGKTGEGNGEFIYPFGIEIDSTGNIWVLEGNNRVQEFDSSGNYLSQFGSEGAGDGQFYGLFGIEIDSTDNIWIVDQGNNRVQKFDSSGNYLFQFGSEGAGDGEFNAPYDLAIDPAGNVWVTDTGNDRVQKWVP